VSDAIDTLEGWADWVVKTLKEDKLVTTIGISREQAENLAELVQLAEPELLAQLDGTCSGDDDCQCEICMDRWVERGEALADRIRDHGE